MPSHLLPIILIKTIVLLLSVQTAAATEGAFAEIPATPALLEDLRGGGFVLYMRHGMTDTSQPDEVPIDLGDCKTQRPLTDAGRAEITEVGRAIRAAGIPVGEIYSSPLCRAWESARLAFGEGYTIVNDLIYTAHLTSAEKIPVIAMTRRLLSEPVTGGSNRVVVAHAPNMAEVMDYFPRTEGTVIVTRPAGGDFEYIASIRPGDWPVLLAGEAGSNGE